MAEKTADSEDKLKTENFRYTATCLFGLEGLLGEEIDSLGYRRVNTMDGRITFEGDAYACCVCNINLRFAERLYLNMGEFEARSFDELFEGCRALPWESIIGRNDCFPVRGHSIRSKLFSVPDCQKIIKKAVAKRLGGVYNMETLPETGEKYQIDFFLFKDRAALMIDLSGVPLHKRGYRPQSVAAPLRETLAAALVKLSRPREGVLLRDPFCGSGTIAIEGAMMMKNAAPGRSRNFAAESFPVFDKKLWQTARDAAAAAEKNEINFEALGSDIDPDCVEVAKAAAARAGVEGIVRFEVGDALELTTGGVRGTVVTNPPYGERIMRGEVDELYRRMGKAWQSLDRWQLYILTSHPDFQRLFGRRADKVRKLYNGMIPCNFYQYFKNGKK